MPVGKDGKVSFYSLSALHLVADVNGYFPAGSSYTALSPARVLESRQGGGLTTVGDENLIMATAHIAHDCHIGSRCVLTNASLLAGHVTLEDYVILGGASAIHPSMIPSATSTWSWT